MEKLYEKFKKLNIDLTLIGLAEEEDHHYFCTPLDSKIIGWDNGIHYCFIKQYGEIVFVVNPDTCCDYYVYPIAKNFSDFLGLILTTKVTNTLQQIILWDKQHYLEFTSSPEEVEYVNRKDILTIIDKIQSELKIIPIENPFEYVKDIQNQFDYSKIKFSDEFYEITGIEKDSD